MSTARYKSTFAATQKEQRGLLVPFVVLGYPDDQSCFEWIKILVEAGADALEIGIPFSDPVADGPVIQRANVQALAAGSTPGRCLKIVKRVRQQYPALPIGLLVYANLVIHPGVEAFYQHCHAAGIDSVLVADVPVHAGSAFCAAAAAARIAPIFIATPNASPTALEHIARLGQAYTYVVSRAGVTGADQAAGIPRDLVATLKQLHAAPALLGFGIRDRAQVEDAIAAGFAGVICGSALVQCLFEGSFVRASERARRLMAELSAGLGYREPLPGAAKGRFPGTA